MIQEDFWPQARTSRARQPTKTETRNVKAVFSHRPFSCLTLLPSVTKHTTLIFCSRDICYFSVEALLSALQHPQIAKENPQGPTKGPNAPSRPSANSPRFRISSTLSNPNPFARSSDCFSAAMKFFESQHEFDYSWEEVSTANWRKYCPWNDKSTHVIAVDTISRHVDPITGIVSLFAALLHFTSC
jgi:hypothetical protein